MDDTYTGDDPEKIKQCLNCTKEKCNDCLSPEEQAKKRWKAKKRAREQHNE